MEIYVCFYTEIYGSCGILWMNELNIIWMVVQ
jgi:hypothetical protein